MLPNLMRSVIAQVPRGGRSVVSRRGFSSSIGEARGRSVVSRRTFSSSSGKASAGSGDRDFLFLTAAFWGYFASSCLGAYQLVADTVEELQARKSQAEQEDD